MNKAVNIDKIKHTLQKKLKQKYTFAKTNKYFYLFMKNTRQNYTGY